MPDDDVLVRVSKVSEKGLVTIPLEISQKLGLAPGTEMVVIATEDAVALPLPVVDSLSLPCPSLSRRLECLRLHSYRLSTSGASPMLDSAQGPTRQTTFTFGSPDLAVEDDQPYLLWT